jgi:hypothetical protein
MKRLLLLTIVAAAIVFPAVTPAAAPASIVPTTVADNPLYSGFWPNPPWCPTCFIASYPDSHVPGVTPLAVTDYLNGWASLCALGEVPNQITAVANTPSGQTPIDIGYIQNLPRPDVNAHLQANGCDANPNAGFTAWFYDWPVDTLSVTVIFHRQSIVAWHNFPVAGAGQ